MQALRTPLVSRALEALFCMWVWCFEEVAELLLADAYVEQIPQNQIAFNSPETGT
jgi:hypothetical protein